MCILVTGHEYYINSDIMTGWLWPALNLTLELLESKCWSDSIIRAMRSKKRFAQKRNFRAPAVGNGNYDILFSTKAAGGKACVLAVNEMCKTTSLKYSARAVMKQRRWPLVENTFINFSSAWAALNWLAFHWHGGVGRSVCVLLASWH